MKLRPELVPATLWGLSANRLLASAWQRQIRPAIFDEFDGTCSRCGGTTARMFAHEGWVYDEDQLVATLAGIELVCQDCNSCLHIGRLPAQYKAHAFEHLATVNGIPPREVDALVGEAMTQWARRSRFEWRVAVDEQLIRRFPALGELGDRAAAKAHR